MNKILIVDDHPLVREGMKKMLQGAHFEVETAECAQAALDVALRSSPDLVITDIRMPKMDGFELLNALRRKRPGAKVLMLAGTPLTHELSRAKECGAVGYLPKSTPWRDLVDAIRAILDGATFQEETFVEENDGTLTRRELEILRWLAEGKKRDEIAIICGVSPDTVKTHLENIRGKLDVPNAVAAVRRGYELGLLRP